MSPAETQKKGPGSIDAPSKPVKGSAGERAQDRAAKSARVAPTPKADAGRSASPTNGSAGRKKTRIAAAAPPIAAVKNSGPVGKVRKVPDSGPAADGGVPGESLLPLLQKPAKLSKKAAAAKRKLAKLAAARRTEKEHKVKGKPLVSVPNVDPRRIAAVRAAVAAAQAALDSEASSKDAERPRRAPLKKSELSRFRDLLLQKLEKLVGDLRSMESQALHGSGQDSSANHMADYGSDNYEQEFTLGLIENDEQAVNQINEALIRIDNGQYGSCQQCAQTIPLLRLEAIPWTPYCVQCQAMAERW